MTFPPSWRRDLDSRHWRILIASLLGRLFDGYENFILFVLLAPALRDLLTPEQLPDLTRYAGIILGVTVLGRSAGGLLVGVLADYVGRRRTLLMSYVLYAFSTLISGLAPSWVLLGLARCINGASLGGGLALGATLIAEAWPTALRSRGQSWMQTAFGAGGLLANGLWFFLASYTGDAGWRWPFFLSSIPAVLLVFFTHRNVPESEAWIEKNRERTELRTAEGSATPDAYTPGERAILGRFTLVALFAQKDLRRSLLLCILMSFGTIGGYWAVSTWIPVYVETVARAGGYTSMNWAALGGAVFSLGSIPGYLAGGYLAESWVGRRGMLAFYFTGSLVSIAAVYLWADAPLSLLIATFLHGFFTQGQFVWFAIYPPELFPTAVRGSAIATVFNVARGLSLLAPIFSGVLISQFGGYSTMALTFGALYLLALVAVPFSAETRGKPLPH